MLRAVCCGCWYILVNGLEEFPLVLPDPGVVHLPHQLGVLVDEPGLPENVSSCWLTMLVKILSLMQILLSRVYINMGYLIPKYVIIV